MMDTKRGVLIHMNITKDPQYADFFKSINSSSRMALMLSLKLVSQAKNLITLIPWRTSLVIFTRVSLFFMMPNWKTFNFLIIIPFTGIKITINAIPASNDHCK